jgi:hypothetical protein
LRAPAACGSGSAGIASGSIETGRDGVESTAAAAATFVVGSGSEARMAASGACAAGSALSPNTMRTPSAPSMIR